MHKGELHQRTRAFALTIVLFFNQLPKTPVAQTLGKQLLRSGTSVGANYRAALRARSSAEFVSKLGIVEEEADEAIYWLELLRDAEVMPADSIAGICTEATEILKMTVASIKTARANRVR